MHFLLARHPRVKFLECPFRYQLTCENAVNAPQKKKKVNLGQFIDDVSSCPMQCRTQGAKTKYSNLCNVLR